tara:strand:- start:4552 stop:5724 length:1173 start_codon:yes stop_codon:yes gene_type:complete
MDVSANRHLSSGKIFTGESVRVELTISNNKVLPSPWIDIRESLPAGMSTDIQTIPGPSGSKIFKRVTSLNPNENIRWSVSLLGTNRGFYQIGPTVARTGDLFGFFQREEILEHPTSQIVVYPRVFELEEFGLDSSRPFGDLRGGVRLFEDPVLISGIRDYLPTDNLRRIDWAATARTNKLQSRIYEPSRSHALIIALNIPTFRQNIPSFRKSWEGSDPVLLERGISLAASIAYWASKNKLAVGLVANGALPNADQTIRIGAGNKPEQLTQILEALAAVTIFTTGPLSEELDQLKHPLPIGSTIVTIAAQMPAELAYTLNKLRNSGHSVNVLRTSDEDWDPLGFNSLERIQIHEMASRMDELNFIDQAISSDYTIEVPEEIEPTESYEKNK